MGTEDTNNPPSDGPHHPHRTSASRQVHRIVSGVVGVLLILVAIIIVPVPGPWSILLIFLGLTVLSWEFFWAERLLRMAREKLKRKRSAGEGS